jgi:hypothetical protein
VIPTQRGVGRVNVLRLDILLVPGLFVPGLFVLGLFVPWWAVVICEQTCEGGGVWWSVEDGAVAHFCGDRDTIRGPSQFDGLSVYIAVMEPA